MNKKFKSLIAAGGTLVVLASLIPMTSYAATTGTSNISVKVNPYITVTVQEGVVIGGSDGVTPNTVAEGSFSATVTANKGYKLSLSAATADKTALRRDGTSTTDFISAIPNGGTSTLPSGTSAWGIQTQAQKDTDDYTGITTTAVPFYSYSNGATNEVSVFNVGIMVTPSIPSGTYSTEVTVTANTI